MKRRAVFLDRDGVINRVVPRDGRLVSPRTLEDFEIFDFASEAVAEIRRAGFMVFVVTNQPDIARGHMSRETLTAMQAQVEAAIHPDDVRICDHDDHHACACRKPKPGMLLDLAEKHDVDLGASFFIGDSHKDIDAGRAAKVPTILIRRQDNRETSGDAEAESLLAAAHLISERHSMEYIEAFLNEAKEIIDRVDRNKINQMVDVIIGVREAGGRLFFIGSGGGAGHASHAVNDFRKIACIESYTPTDNVSELTARINDDGWDTSYVNWLKTSKINKNDAVFVFSVGGGNLEKNISANLVNCMVHAKEVGAKILGVVGRDGGHAGKTGDAVLIIPNPSGEATAQTEAFQAVIWHLIVSHPRVRAQEMKWESTK